MTRLTDSQVCFIVGALRVASQVYIKDSQCDCMHPRTAEQFRKQSADADALADWLESCDIEVTP